MNGNAIDVEFMRRKTVVTAKRPHFQSGCTGPDQHSYICIDIWRRRNQREGSGNRDCNARGAFTASHGFSGEPEDARAKSYFCIEVVVGGTECAVAR